MLCFPFLPCCNSCFKPIPTHLFPPTRTRLHSGELRVEPTKRGIKREMHVLQRSQRGGGEASIFVLKPHGEDCYKN